MPTTESTKLREEYQRLSHGLELAKCREMLGRLRKEISKVIVGQATVVDGMIRALLANGHVLLEGVPGIAKTLLIKTLASASSCSYSRIQFTPDLLPSDILGVTSFTEAKGFFIDKGPIFANFVLGDEINRASPKVQSAFLEAMQERQVTIGKTTYPLSLPFFVLATQNPIESLGTYPLPEAQIDRFLFKLQMHYPGKEDEKSIIEQNISLKEFETFDVHPVIGQKHLLHMQNLAKQIGHQDRIKEYIVSIVDATRNHEKYGIELGQYIQYGCSPRASINLFIAAKADALMNSSPFIRPQHIKNVAFDVLRHRIILNYRAEAEGITTELIIQEVLNKVKIP